MTSATKYWVARILTFASLALLLYCLSHMIGPGISGHFTEARIWFVGAIAATILGCIAYICAIYFKARADTAGTSTTLDVMNAAAKDITITKTAARTTKTRR